MKEQIEKLINSCFLKTDDVSVDEETKVCWSFCCKIFEMYKIMLPKFPHQGIERILDTDIVIPCVALFKCGESWHSGVVWPDGLHFLHARNEESCFMIRQEKLTRWPWINLLEGFYINV